jgi:attachment invasion locus protein
MKQLFKCASMAVVALVASAAQAQTVYGEVGYMATDFSDSVSRVGLSAKPNAVRGLVGYEISPNLAFEGMLAFGSGTETLRVGGVNSGLGLKIDNMIGAFVKPKMPVGDVFELFGRAGYVSTKLTLDGESDREGSLAYGVGGSFKMTPALSLNVDYMIYHKKDDAKIDGYSVGLNYRF